MNTGNIEELAKRFDIPGCASVVKGLGGLALVKVKTEWSAAEIFLHGAHVAHFQKNERNADFVVEPGEPL